TSRWRPTPAKKPNACSPGCPTAAAPRCRCRRSSGPSSSASAATATACNGWSATPARSLSGSKSDHRQLEPLLLRALPGDFVAGIGVAHHAGAGVVPQHALDAAVGLDAAVADDDHAGGLAVTHADTAAMVEAHPGGAAGDVEHRVEQRPVADRVAAVLHRFGLAVGRGDRAAVEVVAPDHDRRLQFAVADHLVERQAELVALAQADPADACRQALEGDALARHVEPVVQLRVVRD